MCHDRSEVPNVLIAETVFHGNLCDISAAKRNVAQWLERDSLPMSLPVVRLRTRLGAGFSGKFHVSPLSMFGHCFDVMLCTWARHFTLTYLMCKWVPRRTKMAMCAMRRNGCRTPWSWNGIRTIRSSKQWINCKRRLMDCNLTAIWISIFILTYVGPIHKYNILKVTDIVLFDITTILKNLKYLYQHLVLCNTIHLLYAFVEI